MQIGTLEIQLMADMAQLKKDMDDAKASVGGAMGGIESAVSAAKAAFVALGVVGGVNALAGMINGAIEGAAMLKDLSIATGASVASLSSFTEVGRTTGTTTESIATMMNKLAKATTGTADETKGAGAAISALGINFDTFKNLNPDEKLKTVATAMNGFADGSEKSAAAMAILGKSGAEALPFLKDLAETGDLVARVTDAQATASDNFSDNLTTLRASGEAWKTELAMGMVPALDNAATAFLGVMNESGGLREEIRKLSADGTIATWTTNTIVGITRVMDVFAGFGRVVISVGEVIGAWAAMVVEGFSSTFTAIGQAVTGNFGGAMDTMKTMLTRQTTVVGELGTKLSDTWSEETLGQKLRARMGEMKDVGDTSEAAKPKLDMSAVLAKSEEARKAETAAAKAQEAAVKAATDEIKKQEDQYNKLIGSISEKSAAMEAEMQQGVKLTASQVAENKLLADLASSTLILTDAQLANTLEQINNMKAVEDKFAAYQADQKQTAENTKENGTYLDSLQKSTAALIADNEKMRDNNDTMLLSKEELGQLSIAKDLDRAATLDRRAEVIESTMGETAQTIEFRAQSQALRDLAELKEQGIHVKAAKEAQDAWAATTKSIGSGLTSALMGSVESGKDLWLTFRDFLVNTFKNMVLSPVVNMIVNPVANAINGAFSGVLNSITGGVLGNTAGAGAGASGATGSLGTLGSIGSGIGSALGLGGTAAGGFGAGGASGVIGSIGSATGGIGGTLGAIGTSVVEGATAIGGGITSALAAIPGWGWAALGAVALAGILGGEKQWETKYGGAFAKSGDQSVRKLYGNGTGGEFPNQFMQTSIDYAVENINASLKANGSDLYVRSFGAGGESNTEKPEGYSFAGGTLSNGMSFGNERQTTDNLGFATPEEVIAAFNRDMSIASAQALELGLTGQIKTPNVGPEPDGQQGNPPRGFASGGDHMGGWRIVGERGPELEATGPSRIFDATTTASMLRSGGANDGEVASELRLIRQALERINENTSSAADTLKGRQTAPLLVQVVTS